ncbi:OLC1v1005697C1 [Oldenlandia corymbosa var. corymbosa]|uniref:OLC1v1005697C1 n=1 Tax=Oldenlandia corymbosa var. corymbosa TaxID=529605 RepID=A0AAV1DI53_OLDCO|nr:OLC1v1005697C1 [Oldenlandia corymbosa var. corymbosa]
MAMLSRKCWLRFRAIGGSLSLKSLVNLSTATTLKAPNQNADVVDYLVNSLGFSKDAAITTISKVPRLRPSPEKANSVVNYLQNLGVNKSHIRNMVSGHPSLLVCRVDKTLEPKFKYLRELGLSGSDLVKVILGYKFVWRLALDTEIKSRVLYLRQLVGTDDNVLTVLKRYSRVLGCCDTELVESNLKLLRNYGISEDNIVKLIVRRPRRIFATKPEEMEEILHKVERVLRIPRQSAATFHYGVEVIFSFNESNIDEKLEVFRSFGWSDAEIFKMVKMLPPVLRVSSPRIREVLDYFMNELGYSSDYLASRPIFLTYSFDNRVKPRNEVLRILCEKKLNNSKAGLFTVLALPEPRFLKNFILPYKDILPDICEAYLSKTKTPKSK